MPREHVYGNLVTVTDGDLPVLRARAWSDLVVPVPLDPPGTDVLRRRHQLLSQFVESLASYGSELPNDVHEDVRHLRSQLDGLPLVEPTAPAGRLLVADQLESRRVQLRATLTWIRDAGLVTLSVTGHDHDRAEELDLGGSHLDLDWAGCNKLIRKLRVARDQSWGAPE